METSCAAVMHNAHINTMKAILRWIKRNTIPARILIKFFSLYMYFIPFKLKNCSASNHFTETHSLFNECALPWAVSSPIGHIALACERSFYSFASQVKVNTNWKLNEERKYAIWFFFLFRFFLSWFNWKYWNSLCQVKRQ